MTAPRHQADIQQILRTYYTRANFHPSQLTQGTTSAASLAAARSNQIAAQLALLAAQHGSYEAAIDARETFDFEFEMTHEYYDRIKNALMRRGNAR